MLIFMSFLSSRDAVLLLPKKTVPTLVQQDKLCGEAALCEDVQKLLSGLSKCRVQHRMARPAGTSKIIRYLRRQASRQRWPFLIGLLTEPKKSVQADFKAKGQLRTPSVLRRNGLPFCRRGSKRHFLSQPPPKCPQLVSSDLQLLFRLGNALCIQKLVHIFQLHQLTWNKRLSVRADPHLPKLPDPPGRSEANTTGRSSGIWVHRLQAEKVSCQDAILFLT